MTNSDLCFLYAVNEYGTEFCKVGITSHMDKRLCSLQSGNPRKLDMSPLFQGTRDDCHFLEQMILSSGLVDRAVGEWVRADLDDILGLVKTLIPRLDSRLPNATKPPVCTKAQARKLLGVKNNSELANELGIIKQAVSAWGGDDDPIPEGRYWQVRAMLAEGRQTAA